MACIWQLTGTTFRLLFLSRQHKRVSVSHDMTHTTGAMSMCFHAVAMVQVARMCAAALACVLVLRIIPHDVRLEPHIRRDVTAQAGPFLAPTEEDRAEARRRVPRFTLNDAAALAEALLSVLGEPSQPKLAVPPIAPASAQHMPGPLLMPPPGAAPQPAQPAPADMSTATQTTQHMPVHRLVLPAPDAKVQLEPAVQQLGPATLSPMPSAAMRLGPTAPPLDSAALPVAQPLPSQPPPSLPGVALGPAAAHPPAVNAPLPVPLLPMQPGQILPPAFGGASLATPADSYAGSQAVVQQLPLVDPVAHTGCAANGPAALLGAPALPAQQQVAAATLSEGVTCNAAVQQPVSPLSAGRAAALEALDRALGILPASAAVDCAALGAQPSTAFPADAAWLPAPHPAAPFPPLGGFVVYGNLPTPGTAAPSQTPDPRLLKSGSAPMGMRGGPGYDRAAAMDAEIRRLHADMAERTRVHEERERRLAEVLCPARADPSPRVSAQAAIRGRCVCTCCVASACLTTH